MKPAVLALATLLGAGSIPPGDEIENYLRVGDYEAAIASLEESLAETEAETVRGEIAVMMAECYLGMRLPLKASDALGRVPSTQRSGIRYSYCRAEVLVSSGEAAQAEKLLRGVVRDKPDGRSIFRLAVLQYERGDYQGVENLLRGNAKVVERDYYSQIYRARALLSLVRPADSLAVLVALGKKHDTAEIQYLVGRAHSLAGSHGKATRSFRLALKADGNYLESAFALSRSLRREGDKPGASEAMKLFTRLQKNDRERLRQANIFSQRCRRDSATATDWLQAGEFHLQTGSPDQAVSHSWRALALDPADPGARLLLARGLRNTGAYGQADLHYRKVIIQSPANKKALSEWLEMRRKHAKN